MEGESEMREHSRLVTPVLPLRRPRSMVLAGNAAEFVPSVANPTTIARSQEVDQDTVLCSEEVVQYTKQQSQEVNQDTNSQLRNPPSGPRAENASRRLLSIPLNNRSNHTSTRPVTQQVHNAQYSGTPECSPQNQRFSPPQNNRRRRTAPVSDSEGALDRIMSGYRRQELARQEELLSQINENTELRHKIEDLEGVVKHLQAQNDLKDMRLSVALNQCSRLQETVTSQEQDAMNWFAALSYNQVYASYPTELSQDFEGSSHNAHAQETHGQVWLASQTQNAAAAGPLNDMTELSSDADLKIRIEELEQEIHDANCQLAAVCDKLSEAKPLLEAQGKEIRERRSKEELLFERLNEAREGRNKARTDLKDSQGRETDLRKQIEELRQQLVDREGHSVESSENKFTSSKDAMDKLKAPVKSGEIQATNLEVGRKLNEDALPLSEKVQQKCKLTPRAHSPPSPPHTPMGHFRHEGSGPSSQGSVEIKQSSWKKKS